MAVPDPNLYYKNMAAGKTSTGGQANYGQMEWAKAQLAKVPDPATAKQSTMAVPKTNIVPNPNTKKSVGSASSSGFSQPHGIPNPGISVPAPPQQPAATFSAPQYNDWLAKQNETFANLEKLVNTPFSYNPETDPGYLAQRQLSQQRAGVATQNALESANDRGIMGSSMNISQLGQIQQSAEQEALAYIPEYRQQAYGQHQNQLANAANVLRQSMDLRNQQFGESVTEAELTGSYLPAGAQQLVNQLQSLKGQAEVKGLPNTEVKVLSAQADQLRAQLQSMGVDVSKIGADISLANSTVGQRTIHGQQLDHSRVTDQRNFDYGVERDARGDFVTDRNFDEGVRQHNQGFEYTQGRDATKDAQWQKEFDRILKQDGVQNALAWASNSISQQNANTSAYSADTSRMNADNSRLMDIWQATGMAPEGIPGVAVGTPYGSDLDRSYRQAQVDQMSVKSEPTVPKPTKNDLEAEYYTNLDRMQNQGIDLKSFFNNEKENIIRDLGKSGFDALKQSYGIYN